MVTPFILFYWVPKALRNLPSLASKSISHLPPMELGGKPGSRTRQTLPSRCATMCLCQLSSDVTCNDGFMETHIARAIVIAAALSLITPAGGDGHVNCLDAQRAFARQKNTKQPAPLIYRPPGIFVFKQPIILRTWGQVLFYHMPARAMRLAMA
jgi:hypothetical protein